MNIILMREERDCHNAAIATACQVTYEQATNATGHKDLPGMLESPIYSNPWNMYRALINIGFWKRNITWQDIASGNYAAGKTIVLVHDPKSPTFNQHWIVLGDYEAAFSTYRAFWGDSEKPRLLSKGQLKELFLKGFPNCAFEVYPANVLRLAWERLKTWLKGE